MGLMGSVFADQKHSILFNQKSVFQMNLGRAGSVPEGSTALPTSSHLTPAKRQGVICESAFWTSLKRLL